MHRRLALLAALALTAAALLAACGGSEEAADGGPLVVYSGREEELVGPLYAQFTEATGIELDVRYGSSGEMAALIAEEGDASPADVFYSQTSGDIGAVGGQLAPLPQDLLDLVAEPYRSPEGRWVGITGRVRVLAYNTDAVADDQLPASVLELASPDWRLGDIGVAPTNASFIAFVGALRLTIGDEETQAFLDGLAEHARSYEKNGQIIDAIAAGEITTGLVNHYYLYERLGSEIPADAPVANHLFDPTDIGSLNNVSAAGTLASSDRQADAEQLIRFLLADGQAYFAETTSEYPLAEGAAVPADLPPLPETGPAVSLNDLAKDLETTVAMIEKAGLIA